MVRYFYNPETGKLEFLKTVAAIKRKFGDIPFFISKPFAQAYNIERAVGDNWEQFRGSTPEIGVKTSDVERAIVEIKEIWGFKGLSLREIAKRKGEQLGKVFITLQKDREVRAIQKQERLELEREAELERELQQAEEDEAERERLEDEEITQFNYWIFETPPHNYASGHFKKDCWTLAEAETIFTAYWAHGEFVQDERQTDVEKAFDGDIIIRPRPGKVYQYTFACGASVHSN